jgi:hypothetical protein
VYSLLEDDSLIISQNCFEMQKAPKLFLCVLARNATWFMVFPPGGRFVVEKKFIFSLLML